MRGEEFHVGFAQPLIGGVELVPIGVDDRGHADIVEALALFIRKLQLGGGEVVLELGFGAPADDH